MKFLTIIGARPQFIKAAPLSRELRQRHREVLVHTGQHYDYGMSEQFFREMGIPRPDYNLEAGSGSHGAQTAAMLSRLEPVVIRERPDAVIVFGDTNSTLAGALTAAKLNVPLAHIEAGMRSFNRRMPEEVNRVVADHLSNLHFCSTRTAVENLRREGISRDLFLVGDIMHDALKSLLPPLPRIRRMLGELSLADREYLFVTIHRAENTDRIGNLSGIVRALLLSERQVIFPVHPRTEARLRKTPLWIRLRKSPAVRVVPPLGYAESLALQSRALAVLTDSGGIQKEAYLLKTPCLTARGETEWVETIQAGWNRLVGSDSRAILKGLAELRRPTGHPALYGRGDSARRIVRQLEKRLGR
jgi:UDP-N-acetylglucosamine 2-epimerase